jgi:hypothetical protein
MASLPAPGGANSAQPPVFLRPNLIPSMFREMPTDNRSGNHFAEAFRRSFRIDPLPMPSRERKFRLSPGFCNTASKLCQHG